MNKFPSKQKVLQISVGVFSNMTPKGVNLHNYFSLFSIIACSPLHQDHDLIVVQQVPTFCRQRYAQSAHHMESSAKTPWANKRNKRNKGRQDKKKT